MNRVRSWLVWLSRIHKCRGFGIQSPTDYAFVRYVVNEHWPYYAYEQLGGGDWLTRKLGRLYFRLANWRQPGEMPADRYSAYWKAGCQRVRFVAAPERIALARVEAGDAATYESLLARCDEHSVVVVESLWRAPEFWQRVVSDDRVGTTFDLYYCGILFFDKQRYRHHYKVNF